MLTEEFETNILDILEEECSKDKKTGLFYTEIYGDIMMSSATKTS